MRETTKANRIRSIAWKNRYLSGRVLDIGAGDDPVCPTAQVFDRAQGDAEHILDYLPPAAVGYFDTVVSSHCLEHMRDPQKALADWWKLVRPGGHLVLVVPDCQLYEQGAWPSRWNQDHKWTFAMFGWDVKEPHTFSVLGLVSSLPGSRVISLELQDHSYDCSKRGVDQTLGDALAQIECVARKVT